MAGDLTPAARAPLVAAAFLVLLAGMGGGLARLGFDWPFPMAAAHHGTLMVGGFFGTVIALERAVALARAWAYAAPLASAAGALLLLIGMPSGAYLLVLAGLVFLGASVCVWRRQRVFFTAVLLGGAACWLLGNTLAAAYGPAAALPWWIAFFVLTIAGERLELNRLLPPRRKARDIFAAIVLCLLVGGFASGTLFSLSLAAMAAWLAVNDVARHTVKGRGLPRYVAASLLAGYAWLLAGGLLMLVPMRDAALHAVLIGFVFSMVFGHAPIIFPSILRVRIGYSPWMYLPLALLHASLAIRVAGHTALGGAGNALAILVFLFTMAGITLRTRLAVAS